MDNHPPLFTDCGAHWTTDDRAPDILDHDWQKTDDQHHHLDQPYFRDPTAKLEWFARRSYALAQKASALAGLEYVQDDDDAPTMDAYGHADIVLDDILSRFDPGDR